MPDNHYRSGEELDDSVGTSLVDMDNVPQRTVSADDYLQSSQMGDDDLDFDIPNDDDEVT